MRRLAGRKHEDEGSALRAAAAELMWGRLSPGAGAGQRGEAQPGSVSPLPLISPDPGLGPNPLGLPAPCPEGVKLSGNARARATDLQC